MSFYTDKQNRVRPLTASRGRRYQELQLQIMRTVSTGIPYVRELKIGQSVYDKLDGKRGTIVGFTNDDRVEVDVRGIRFYYKAEQLGVVQ